MEVILDILAGMLPFPRRDSFIYFTGQGFETALSLEVKNDQPVRRNGSIRHQSEKGYKKVRRNGL